MRWYFVATSGSPPDGTGVYCSQDIDLLFTSPLTGTGIYCSQNIDLLFASPLTGTGVYCSQDLAPLTTEE